MRVAVIAYYGTFRSVLVNNAARQVTPITSRAISIDHSVKLRLKSAISPPRFRVFLKQASVIKRILNWNASLEPTYGSQRNFLGVPAKYDLEMRILENTKLKPWDARPSSKPFVVANDPGSNGQGTGSGTIARIRISGKVTKVQGKVNT